MSKYKTVTEQEFKKYLKAKKDIEMFLFNSEITDDNEKEYDELCDKFNNANDDVIDRLSNGDMYKHEIVHCIINGHTGYPCLIKYNQLVAILKILKCNLGVDNG